jgi:hypothetical protein
MRKNATLAALLLTAPAIASDDFKTGWRVVYEQDVFSQQVLAVAYVTQETEQAISFDQSQLQIVCASDEKLVAAFSIGGFSMESTHDVSFRSEDGSITKVSFRRAKAQGDRSVIGASQADSNVLMDLFRNAKAQIAFKTGNKQGLLPVIGAAYAMDAVAATCGTSS